MKKTMIVALLLVWSSAGCLLAPPRTVTDSVNVPPLPPGPITAEQVEPANAHRIADAVWDEMDRDQQKDLLPASGKDSKKR